MPFGKTLMMCFLLFTRFYESESKAESKPSTTWGEIKEIESDLPIIDMLKNALEPFLENGDVRFPSYQYFQDPLYLEPPFANETDAGDSVNFTVVGIFGLTALTLTVIDVRSLHGDSETVYVHVYAVVNRLAVLGNFTTDATYTINKDKKTTDTKTGLLNCTYHCVGVTACVKIARDLDAFSGNIVNYAVDLNGPSSCLNDDVGSELGRRLTTIVVHHLFKKHFRLFIQHFADTVTMRMSAGEDWTERISGTLPVAKDSSTLVQELEPNPPALSEPGTISWKLKQVLELYTKDGEVRLPGQSLIEEPQYPRKPNWIVKRSGVSYMLSTEFRFSGMTNSTIMNVIHVDDLGGNGWRVNLHLFMTSRLSGWGNYSVWTLRSECHYEAGPNCSPLDSGSLGNFKEAEVSALVVIQIMNIEGSYVLGAVRDVFIYPSESILSDLTNLGYDEMDLMKIVKSDLHDYPYVFAAGFGWLLAKEVGLLDKNEHV